MRKQPRLTKPTDIFRRKIVITIPPWGVPVFAVIVAVSIGIQITRMLVIFLLIVVLCALIATVIQHRLVNELRYSIHNILHDIENEHYDPAPTFEAYQPEMERIPLKDVSPKNGSKPRVSKR